MSLSAWSLGYHPLVSIMCYLPDKVVVDLAVFDLEIRTICCSPSLRTGRDSGLDLCPFRHPVWIPVVIGSSIGVQPTGWVSTRVHGEVARGAPHSIGAVATVFSLQRLLTVGAVARPP